VSTAIYVEYLSAHLRRLRKVENSINNVCYVRYFSHWLQRLKKVLGIIRVHWGVQDAGGYGVEADAFFCVFDCETPNHRVQAPFVIIGTEPSIPAIG